MLTRKELMTLMQQEEACSHSYAFLAEHPHTSVRRLWKQCVNPNYLMWYLVKVHGHATAARVLKAMRQHVSSEHRVCGQTIMEYYATYKDGISYYIFGECLESTPAEQAFANAIKDLAVQFNIVIDAPTKKSSV